MTLPEGVTRVEEQAFTECPALTTVNLPNSLTRIENYVFANSSALTQINLPESLTYIGFSAFENCSALTQVVFPAGVDTIANHSFSGCNALAKMTVLAVQPPFVRESTFNGISNEIPVYVLSDALSSYQSATVWAGFNLQAYELPVFTAMKAHWQEK